MGGRWKLSAADERTWRRSEAIAAIRVPRSPGLATQAVAIAEALAAEDRSRVEAASQRLVDLLCAALEVPTLRLEVRGIRPRNSSGELHGLYTPATSRHSRDRVQVWMRTARRQQVVAFKTFLRTVLHELCHHLDYELLRLPRSFHTTGFYKRESSLVHAALAGRGSGSPSAAGRGG